MENLKQKKKTNIDRLGIVVYSVINSDILSKKDVDLVYDITKVLKIIISKQEKEIGKKRVLDDQWKKLIEIYGIVKTYNKKKKGKLINLWNELEDLFKSEISKS